MLSRVSRSCFPAVSLKRGFSTVTASSVKELREKSGAPMMECKKALSAEGVNGDIRLAMDWLRAKGIARASANSDRVSKEGLIALSTNPSGSVTLLEVNSETDFLSMNKDFQNFVVAVTDTITHNAKTSGFQDVDAILSLKVAGDNNEKNLTVKEALGDVVSTIRENILIKRAEVFHPANSTSVIASYIHGKVISDNIPAHIQLGKTASVVNFSVTPENATVAEHVRSEMGRKLAMHVVVAKPTYLAPENVPADVMERETAIFKEQTLDSTSDPKKKPTKPEMIEKIVAGKVAKRLNEISLLGQAHLTEEGGPVIKKFLETYSAAHKSDVKIDSFVRWTLGQEE